MTKAAVPWWKTDLGDAEVAAVSRAIRERHINQGPLCEELERRLAEQLEVAHVAVTTSGSVALLLALMAHDVGPGDEIVLPSETFIAPAHATRLLGATVRLVDVRPDRPLIDVDQLATAITAKTKAVVVVHLNGRACDLEAVRRIADDAGVKVIEDCAQAFMSHGERGLLGREGDASSFSMGVTKLITAGEGGFVATASRETYERLKRLRNHGVESIARNVFDDPGFNFRLTDMQAAIGLAQLDRLQEKIDGVKRVYRFYDERLRDLHYIRMLEVRVDQGELPLRAEAVCSERDKVVRLLAERGIEAKPFHPPLTASAHLSAEGSFPNADRIAATGVTLPSGPDQDDGNLERTVDALCEIADQIETPLPAADA
jgi:perosamine synthetase